MWSVTVISALLHTCLLLLLLLLQPFNGLFSMTTWVSRCQKGKTNLYFTGARDSEWQWNQLDHMQVCTSLQTDNHSSTLPLCFLQAGRPSCRPANSVKALKAQLHTCLTALFSRTTRVSRYQNGKTNLDFIEARDSEWQQLGHMQVCTSLQTDNHASIPPLSFFTGRVPLPAAQPTASKH